MNICRKRELPLYSWNINLIQSINRNKDQWVLYHKRCEFSKPMSYPSRNTLIINLMHYPTFACSLTLYQKVAASVLLCLQHTHLRHYCKLNYDLCKRNILNRSLCSCGKQEDAYNFFFVWKIIPLLEILFSIACSCLNWSVLICGDINLPLQMKVVRTCF